MILRKMMETWWWLRIYQLVSVDDVLPDTVGEEEGSAFLPVHTSCWKNAFATCEQHHSTPSHREADAFD